MVANLVDENVCDDVAQGVLALGPVIENGAAIEEDHVRLARQIAEASPIKAYALVKAHQIEGAFHTELFENLVGREVFDADDEVAAHLAEMLRQPRPGFGSQLLDIFKGGSASVAPIEAIGHRGCI